MGKAEREGEERCQWERMKAKKKRVSDRGEGKGE